jgi:hypothetical protein
MFIKGIKLLAVCAAMCFLICVIGCAPSIQFQTATFATLDPSTQAKQEIDNISIEMNVLPDKEYEKSYYKQTINVFKGLYNGKEIMRDVEVDFSQYFDKSTPFEVTIINNTNHILRMRDSRIVFIEPGSDEPKLALDKQTISEDIESALPSFKPIFDVLSHKYYRTKPSYLKDQIVIAMKHVTNNIVFINGFNQEIMPGMRIKGIVAFPIESKQVAQGKVSFIDMVSETDNAGNITKKVRFDFRITTIDKFYRYNPSTDKGFVEIKKDEYDARPK